MVKLLTRCAQNFLVLASISSLLLLGGCQTTPIAVPVEIPRAKMVIPPVDPLSLDTIQWIIITRDNAKQVFDDLESKGIDPALFGLTDINYERIAINFTKIRALVMQQNAVIEAYKAYYEDQAPTNVKVEAPTPSTTQPGESKKEDSFWDKLFKKKEPMQ